MHWQSFSIGDNPAFNFRRCSYINQFQMILILNHAEQFFGINFF